MQLVYYPDIGLMKVCVDAEKQTPQARARLASKMWKIVRKKRGVGLSATQVGLDIRVFVWVHNGCDHIIWNPVLTYLSGIISSQEGCLSLPKVSVNMKRAIFCFMTGEDIEGKKVRFQGDEVTTRIWQHEIDHLDGKLIIDNMDRKDTLSNKDALRTLLGKTSA